MTAAFRWNRDQTGTQADARQALEDLMNATNALKYAEELMRQETVRIIRTHELNDRADGKTNNDTERLLRHGKAFTPGGRGR